MPESAAASAAKPNARELARFLWAKRQLESGQNYKATNKASSASGAYQYLDSAWQAPSRKAIWQKYGNYQHAYLAPAKVQDAVAIADAVRAWKTYRNWSQVAMSSYAPTWASDPSKWDQRPLGNSNLLTPREYANKVLSLMGAFRRK